MAPDTLGAVLPARPVDAREREQMAAAARLQRIVPILIDAAFGKADPNQARALLAQMGVEL